MTNDFLPEGYEVPKGDSRYMKLEQGDNKFRILAKPIFGWEGWKEVDGKNTPVRFRMDEKPIDLRVFKDQKVTHFWAMPVWNFRAKAVQVLELTQSTIQGPIESFARNEDWGSPLRYSITINRQGEGLETTYMVTPSPKQEVPADVVEAFEKVLADGFNINRLYRGADPFTDDGQVETVRDVDVQA